MVGKLADASRRAMKISKVLRRSKHTLGVVAKWWKKLRKKLSMLPSQSRRMPANKGTNHVTDVDFSLFDKAESFSVRSRAQFRGECRSFVKEDERKTGDKKTSV